MCHPNFRGGRAIFSPLTLNCHATFAIGADLVEFGEMRNLEGFLCMVRWKVRQVSSQLSVYSTIFADDSFFHTILVVQVLCSSSYD